MPAKFIKTYKYTAPDGKEFDALEAEISYEINLLMDGVDSAAKGEFVTWLVDNRSQVIPILSQRERKHASPEKRAPRKRKVAAVETV